MTPPTPLTPAPELQAPSAGALTGSSLAGPEQALALIPRVAARVVSMPGALLVLSKGAAPGDLLQLGCGTADWPSDTLAALTQAALQSDRGIAHPLPGAPSAAPGGLPACLGVPVLDLQGARIGALCAWSDRAQSPSAGALEDLRELAALSAQLLDLHARAAQADVLAGRLAALEADLDARATHDPLTGAWNRPAIMNILTQAHARAMRDQRAFGVMLLDTDYFRQGAAARPEALRDQILLAVVARLRDTLRGGDAIGRIGGDQFICVLENCDIEAAREVAERCRAAVSDLPVKVDLDGPSLTMVSIRIGLLMVHPNSEVRPVDILLRADELLDQARQDARHRVAIDVIAPAA